MICQENYLVGKYWELISLPIWVKCQKGPFKSLHNASYYLLGIRFIWFHSEGRYDIDDWMVIFPQVLIISARHTNFFVKVYCNAMVVNAVLTAYRVIICQCHDLSFFICQDLSLSIGFESFSDFPESWVWLRADFQIGSRVLKKVFWTFFIYIYGIQCDFMPKSCWKHSNFENR